MSQTHATPTAQAAPTARAPSRGRLVLARALTVLGMLLLVVSLLANFVKREALDPGVFRDTSRSLIADQTIRDQVAATMVDQLYANVDVSGSLSDALPSNLNGLAGPISGIAREAVDRTARVLLEQPRVQSTFVAATSLAQREFVAVLDGDTKVLATSGGKVVLDVRPLVLDLGNRFQFIPNLQGKIPESAAKVQILQSDQLKTAQDVTKALRFVADWIFIPTLALWAAAIALVRGRRRIEVRAMAVGIVLTGILVLIARTLAGRYILDHLVTSDSVRPAVSNAYDILTRLLSGAGWTVILIGAIALLGTWFSGPGRRSTATRSALAGYLRRPGIAYGALVLAYLVLLWWQPTPQFGYARNVLIFFGLALVGMEALRRQTAREFPDAEPASLFAGLGRGTLATARARRAPHGPTSELERLAALHTSGALNDQEFAAAKDRLLAGTGAPT